MPEQAKVNSSISHVAELFDYEYIHKGCLLKLHLQSTIYANIKVLTLNETRRHIQSRGKQRLFRSDIHESVVARGLSNISVSPASRQGSCYLRHVTSRKYWCFRATFSTPRTAARVVLSWSRCCEAYNAPLSRHAEQRHLDLLFIGRLALRHGKEEVNKKPCCPFSGT